MPAETRKTMSHGNRSTTALRLALGVVLLLAPWRAPAQDDAVAHRSARGFDPHQVEAVVVGSPHLRQMNPEDRPATDLIRRKLVEFEPDHVVVEWLQPSIDPATTDNYRPFEDLSVLARLWGYDLSEMEAAAAHTLEALNAQKQCGSPVAPVRVELGKLHYLGRDRLNAGYQWWIAGRLGADVGDLERLTNGNFEGHELEAWEFPVAYGQGLEYITPFDYQGDDGAWIWMEIVHSVIAHALSTKHGFQEGDEGWTAAVKHYADGAEAWANEGKASWLEQYGDIGEVAEFAEVVEIWMERRSRDRTDSGSPGLAEMRYNQSPEHASDTRYTYDEVFPRISLDSLGQSMVDKWMLHNRRMIDFVEQNVERMDSKRVMILVGEGHRPFIIDALEESGHRVRSASEFMP